MVLKPIPLSAFAPSFVPPVTGIGGLLAPVANSFDGSGLFQQRGRLGTGTKRRRGEEIDQVFDRSEVYPPLSAPGKPTFNIPVIRELVISASSAGRDIRDLLEDQDTDPKIKSLGKITLSLLAVVEAMLEGGFVPLSSMAVGSQKTLAPGRRGSTAGTPPIPPPKPSPAGLKELQESLERAEKETVLFDANLGLESAANRNTLATALSSGIRAAAVGIATEQERSPDEAVRVMEDALSCVADMEFLGPRSKKFYNRHDAGDNRNGNFCTMPIKIKFDEKESRINFERTIKQNCNLRAVMSLPQPIRTEQSAFLKALRKKYPLKIVTVRPDTRSLEFVAFTKSDGDKQWTRCQETLAIPPNILLGDYNPREEIILSSSTRVDGDSYSPQAESHVVSSGSEAQSC